MSQPEKTEDDRGASPWVPWGLLLRRAGLLYLLSRAVLFASTFIAWAMSTPRANNPDKNFQAFPLHWFWDGWVRWDAGWYARVVERGYFWETPQSDVAFFPLYPLLTRGLAWVVGNHWIAGLVVSNLALLCASFVVLAIMRRYADEDEAERALFYLLVFPTSFFFSAYYTESLFLLTSSASFYFYLRGQNLRCGVAGFLAAMTRSSGVLLFFAFVAGAVFGRRLRPSSLWWGLIPCGVLAFMLLLWHEVGDPLAFVRAQAGWGRHATFPAVTLWQEIGRIDFGFPRHLRNTDLALCCAVTVLFLSLPLLLREVDVALPAYSLLLILLPLSSGSVMSMTRFAAVAFPAFLALARLGRNPLVDRCITCFSAMLLGVLSSLFGSWYWAG